MTWRVWITADPPDALSQSEIDAAAAEGITEVWHGVPLARRSTVPEGTLGVYEVPPEAEPAFPAETLPDGTTIGG